jgi:hypothetical protein
VSGLSTIETAEHLELTLSLAPHWDAGEANPDEQAAVRSHARRLAWTLDMDLGVGPPERSEVGGEAVYTWPLQPCGFQEPILLPFEHGWSRSWDWPEPERSRNWWVL